MAQPGQVQLDLPVLGQRLQLVEQLRQPQEGGIADGPDEERPPGLRGGRARRSNARLPLDRKSVV